MTSRRHLDTASFVHMRHGKLILVAVTRANANAFLILKYLHNLIEARRALHRRCRPVQHRASQVLESYFGVVDEESIRNNFVLIYELLDGDAPHGPAFASCSAEPSLPPSTEMMDFGYPQNTDSDILKLVITQKALSWSAAPQLQNLLTAEWIGHPLGAQGARHFCRSDGSRQLEGRGHHESLAWRLFLKSLV